MTLAIGLYLPVTASLKHQKRKWQGPKSRLSKYKWAQTFLLNLKVSSEYYLQIYKLMSSSSHILVFWFLVESYQKTKISAVKFVGFSKKSESRLIWGNIARCAFFRKSKQIWRLIFYSFGSHLPNTKRQKYEMNGQWNLFKRFPNRTEKKTLFYKYLFLFRPIARSENPGGGGG